MTGFRSACGLGVACVLLACGVVAQPASAATSGQTIFECSKLATTKEFSDAHCKNKTSPQQYGHVAITAGEKVSTIVENVDEAEADIPKLHGFANITIDCERVDGSVTAVNTFAGEHHEGTGTTGMTGSVEFDDGPGTNCATNQAKCSVNISAIRGEAVTVEGLAPAGGGMGLEFQPPGGVGGQFGTATWEGGCGLAAFGAIPIRGSTIATANGLSAGSGATAFLGEMNSLTIGGETLILTTVLTFAQASTKNKLVLTTPPF